ncbi:MAG: ATP-binding cassette domain-containing protein, partial [Desulfamplus sp.]|nr:ATP-binding cassette domain-containing protein [Desulfamplus sp.]
MTNTIFNINRVTSEISHKKYLKDISLQICQGEFWAVLGTNASGKSGLGQLLAGRLKVISGEILAQPESRGYISFEKHSEIMDDIIKNDDTDFIDCIDTGPLVEDFILNAKKIPTIRFINKKDKINCLPHTILPKASQSSISHKKMEALTQQFGIAHLRQRGIRFLSTGEIRKTMICQALMNDPQLLILDEPYDGLDIDSKKSVEDAVASLNSQGIAVVLILNRFREIPKQATHILYVNDCMIQLKG